MELWLETQGVVAMRLIATGGQDGVGDCTRIVERDLKRPRSSRLHQLNAASTRTTCLFYAGDTVIAAPDDRYVAWHKSHCRFGCTARSSPP